MHDSDVAETDQLLIRHFIKGLACDDTKRRTLDRRPRTMADVMKEAENIYGTQLLLSDDPPKVPQGEPSMQEIGSQGKCLVCLALRSRQCC